VGVALRVKLLYIDIGFNDAREVNPLGAVEALHPLAPVVSDQPSPLGGGVPHHPDRLAADQTHLLALVRAIDNRRLVGTAVECGQLEDAVAEIGAAAEVYRNRPLGPRAIGGFAFADLVARPFKRRKRTVAPVRIGRRKYTRPSIVAIQGHVQITGPSGLR
jgi:hypothetical protein